MGLFTTFVNGRLCRGHDLVQDQLVVSPENGLILKRTGYIGGDIVDLEDKIIAPGLLELQTNGMLGFHFTHFNDAQTYEASLAKTSKYLPSTGVTSYWGTIPTVSREKYGKILPHLIPQSFTDGASLLGAHVEGPYLEASKKGAHDAGNFLLPTKDPVEGVYGATNLNSAVKLITLAPEQPGSLDMISSLVSRYRCRISLGHSSATYDQGVAAMSNGASCLTHLFNAMNPLQHRNPGLAGLIGHPTLKPYYSLIADGIHLHNATLSLAYRANPDRAILITDSIELAGLEDGTYPGHAQIPHNQTKTGSRVVIEGTDTLIGSCSSLDQCVRNLMVASGCSLASAIKCATENVAEMMGLTDRGRLEEGRRADFIVLNDDGEILETWIAGKKVWERASM